MDEQKDYSSYYEIDNATVIRASDVSTEAQIELPKKLREYGYKATLIRPKDSHELIVTNAPIGEIFFALEQVGYHRGCVDTEELCSE